MTTVFANSGPSTRANHHIILASSRLPFPTSPSLPDRRAKSKELSSSLVSEENAGLQRGLDMASATEKMAEGKGQGSEGHVRVMAVMGRENVQTRKEESNIVASNSGSSTVRRSRRNIVTSRKRAERSSFTSLVSQSSVSLGNDMSRRGVEEDVGGQGEQNNVATSAG
ncbi:hypothetical protein BsWGS_17594 [Bradybaena similaris]